MNINNNVSKVKLALLAMQRYSWEQGVAAQAFLEQGDNHTVIAMAKEAAYRQIEDGRAAVIGSDGAVTDPCSTGEAILFAYKETGDEVFRDSANNMLEWVLKRAPRNVDGIIYHIENEPQIWVDSMYMLPPFLAAAEYYDEAIKQITGYWKILYSSEKQLMSHIWEDEKNVFIRKDFWGVGNGWAMAGMARVIKMLPITKNQDRNELIEMVKTLIDSTLRYIREDGFFYDVIDNKDTFVETNFSQMLAYTMYRGMTGGWLDKSYQSIADKIRAAVDEKVDSYGLVQDVCGAPKFSSPGVAAEGQAFYLLMEAAANDYNKCIL